MNQLKTPTGHRFALAALLSALLSTSATSACQIPVFRYALERWPADAYRGVIFQRGQLDDKQKATLAQLEENTENKSLSNVEFVHVDLDADMEPQWQQLWAEENTDKKAEASLPWLVLNYPPRANHGRAKYWSGKLNVELAKSLGTSPARTELMKRLREGNSAVWILLESGDAEKDRAARELLETELKKLESTLKLPELDAIVSDSSFVPENPVELKLAFSLMRLSRNNVAESLFVDMLLGTEPDLRDYEKEPLAFPIFGRGRVLWALVGKGINTRTIRSACEYLIGPCSCQVKDQNPGIDLLLQAPWEKWIGKTDAELRAPEGDPSDTIDLIINSLGNPVEPSKVTPETPATEDTGAVTSTVTVEFPDKPNPDAKSENDASTATTPPSPLVTETKKTPAPDRLRTLTLLAAIFVVCLGLVFGTMSILRRGT